MTSAAPGASRARIVAARAVLAIFTLIALWLAVAPAITGSQVVLATAGGSPGWLLGLFRPFGAESLTGDGAGWIYYRALIAAVALWAALVWLAPQLSRRAIWSAVIGLHAISCSHHRCCHKTSSATSPTRAWAWSTTSTPTPTGRSTFRRIRFFRMPARRTP